MLKTGRTSYEGDKQNWDKLGCLTVKALKSKGVTDEDLDQNKIIKIMQKPE